MSIENRLRQDARKYKNIQPPADLRARMSSALDKRPVARIKPWKRWLAPIAVAALLALTILPLARSGFGNDYSALLGGQPPHDDADTASQEDAGPVPGHAIDLAAIDLEALALGGVRKANSSYVADGPFAQVLEQVKQHFDEQFDEVTTLSTGNGLEIFKAVSVRATYTVTVREEGEKVNITID